MSHAPSFLHLRHQISHLIRINFNTLHEMLKIEPSGFATVSFLNLSAVGTGSTTLPSLKRNIYCHPAQAWIFDNIFSANKFLLGDMFFKTLSQQINNTYNISRYTISVKNLITPKATKKAKMHSVTPAVRC